jgi:hypothetical protein
MADTIARAIARGMNSVVESSRLGTMEAEAQANTFETFTKSVIQPNGSARVTVARGSEPESRIQILEISIGPETEAESEIVINLGDGFERVESTLRDGRQTEVWKRRVEVISSGDEPTT